MIPYEVQKAAELLVVVLETHTRKFKHLSMMPLTECLTEQDRLNLDRAADEITASLRLLQDLRRPTKAHGSIG